MHSSSGVTLLGCFCELLGLSRIGSCGVQLVFCIEYLAARRTFERMGVYEVVPHRNTIRP